MTDPAATIPLDMLKRLTDLAAPNATSVADMELIAEMRREIKQVEELASPQP